MEVLLAIVAAFFLIGIAKILGPIVAGIFEALFELFKAILTLGFVIVVVMIIVKVSQ